jgi:hypothetical protein
MLWFLPLKVILPFGGVVLIVSAHVLAKHLAAFEIFPLIQTVKLCWP